MLVASTKKPWLNDLSINLNVCICFSEAIHDEIDPEVKIEVFEVLRHFRGQRFQRRHHLPAFVRRKTEKSGSARCCDNPCDLNLIRWALIYNPTHICAMIRVMDQCILHNWKQLPIDKIKIAKNEAHILPSLLCKALYMSSKLEKRANSLPFWQIHCIVEQLWCNQPEKNSL